MQALQPPPGGGHIAFYVCASTHSRLNCVVSGGMILATPASGFIPDRIVPASEGEPVDLWVYSALPKEEWLPHSPADFVSAEHPGSAIKYRDKIYEVMSVEETVEAGYAFRYRLRPWDPQHTIRHLVEYTLKTQRGEAVAHQEMAWAERLRFLILWLFPIAGLAPDPLQREWENKTGLSMALISFGSAMCGLALAFLLRKGPEDWRYIAIVYYLALESFARLFWIAVTHRPHGSLLLTLPYLLWQGLRPRHPESVQDTGAALLRREDEVRLDRSGNSLRVCSWYFDSILAGSTPVRYEGGLYRPLHWHREGKGLGRRWIYELERAEPQAGVPSVEYTRPRSPDGQKAVEDFTRRLGLAQSFALVWGAYPRRDQLRLQLLYQYEGPRSTAITAGLFLAAGLFHVCAIAAFYRVTILALAGPAYLILESLYRLYHAKAVNEPAGSLVGYILRLAIPPPR